MFQLSHLPANDSMKLTEMSADLCAYYECSSGGASVAYCTTSMDGSEYVKCILPAVHRIVSGGCRMKSAYCPNAVVLVGCDVVNGCE